MTGKIHFSFVEEVDPYFLLYLVQLAQDSGTQLRAPRSCFDMHFVITSSLKRHLKPMLWTSTASCLLHPAKDRRRLRLFTRTIRCFSTQHLLKTSENGIEDPLDGVTIVQSKDQALKALKVLNSKRVRKRLHACDTETSGCTKFPFLHMLNFSS